MSNIKLSGTIVKEDPVLRYLPDGEHKVCNFSLFVSTGKDKDGEYTPGVYVNVSAWDDLAQEINDQLRRKDRVTVEGWVLPPRTWKDKDGNEHPAGLEVKAVTWSKGDGFKDAEPEVEF